ncbi:restriction endonuclease [Bradyrhizobium sp. ARR65]|uniref:restriction endonuclease n=1 Tax=Bradyrhizobium sp. ARR65 TaxID=1040989 RepID=UPI001AEC8E64|nr:restriction endonuclease [Bradyrhizobium sp. ARR65]
MNNQAMQFEELCAELLQSMGYTADRQVALSSQRRFDFVITKNCAVERVVEVKFIRENPGTLATLRNVVSRVKSYFGASPFDQLLILSCVVAAEHKAWLFKEFKLEIWDREDILGHAEKSRQLQNRFATFFKEQDDAAAGAARRSLSDPIVTDGIVHDEETMQLLPDPRGVELSQRLADTPRGKRGAKLYEALILDILEYLFGDYLLDPRIQARLEDKLSVLDVVYRVGQGHPFWETFTRDFRARVIVFECKNYSLPIKPNQLHTTERYMSASALRPVCFLMTRVKPHEHTELAAFGAMREGGKLFVFLDDEDIYEMLRIRDVQLRLPTNNRDYLQNDPTVVLDQKIYDFLSRMPR